MEAEPVQSIKLTNNYKVLVQERPLSSRESNDFSRTLHWRRLAAPQFSKGDLRQSNRLLRFRMEHTSHMLTVLKLKMT